MWFCFVLEGSGSVELRNWDSQRDCRGWKVRWIAIERVRFVMSLVAMVLFGLTRSIWHTARDSRGTGFVRRSTLWMTWGPFSYSGEWNIQFWGWRRLGVWSIGAWKLRRVWSNWEKFSFEAAWSSRERLCIIKRSEVRVLEINYKIFVFYVGVRFGGGDLL